MAGVLSHRYRGNHPSWRDFLETHTHMHGVRLLFLQICGRMQVGVMRSSGPMHPKTHSKHQDELVYLVACRKCLERTSVCACACARGASSSPRLLHCLLFTRLGRWIGAPVCARWCICVQRLFRPSPRALPVVCTALPMDRGRSDSVPTHVSWEAVCPRLSLQGARDTSTSDASARAATNTRSGPDPPCQRRTSVPLIANAR